MVGLMSGTSADGIDAVVAEISGSGRGLRARVLAHTHQPFPPALRRRILRVCLHGTVAEICELNFVLGEHFARAALAAIRRAKRKPADIAAIGSHGQTIHHLPNARTPSTLQIGEPAVIAERTGITTVADFRVRDMAAGGQGAPLVPYADWALFTDDDAAAHRAEHRRHRQPDVPAAARRAGGRDGVRHRAGQHGDGCAGGGADPGPADL